MKKAELTYTEILGVFERLFISPITGAQPLEKEYCIMFAQLSKERVLSMQYLAQRCKQYEDAYKKCKDKFHWFQYHVKQYRSYREIFVQIISSNIPKREKDLLEIITKTLQDKHSKTLKGQIHKKPYRWIRINDKIKVQGLTLTRGLFYVGDFFKIPQSYREIIAFDFKHREFREYNRNYKLFKIYGPVIQTDQPISYNNLKIMPFSSYQDMDPTHRYEYLEWLAGKKTISEISYDTFLLYLFGLQLRMFIDETTTEQDREDIVKYSIDLYVQCQKENVYSHALEYFIDAAISKYFINRLIELVPKDLLPHLSFCHDALIFNALKNNKDKTIKNILTIVCHDIFSILNYDGTIPSHCLNEYIYDQFANNVYEDLSKRQIYVGNKLVNLVDKLKKIDKGSGLQYEMYCIGFNNHYSKLCFDYIFNFWLFTNSRYVGNVYSSFATCFKDVAKQLKDYKVLYPVSPTLAQFMLPSYFRIQEHDEVVSLQNFLRLKTKEQEYALINFSDILCFGVNSPQGELTISKSQISLSINCLERIGYHVVPNMILNEEPLSLGDRCVIYRSSQEQCVEERKAIDRLLPVLKVAAFIVGEKASSSAIQIADDFIKLNIRTEESARHLVAYFRWRLINPILSPIDYKNIKKVGLSMKEVLSELFVHLACADGQFSSQKQEKLTKILSIIDINPQTMHTLIHRISTKEDEFVTIEKTDDAVEYTIERETYPQAISFNDEHLANVETQTKQAQDLLSDIFEEKDEEIGLSNQKNNVLLDILKKLFTKELWKRNEIESLCQKHHLMIGSVLEQINDYSYCKVEDAVIEDAGDTIYVITEYKNKLI